MDTSGFYNKSFMLRAGEFVYGPGYSLRRDMKDSYRYPVEGWWWFDTAEQAAVALDVDMLDFNLDLPPEE